MDCRNIYQGKDGCRKLFGNSPRIYQKFSEKQMNFKILFLKKLPKGDNKYNILSIIFLQDTVMFRLIFSYLAHIHLTSAEKITWYMAVNSVSIYVTISTCSCNVRKNLSYQVIWTGWQRSVSKP